MPCGCGKPKCNGKCGISPAVLQINNNECTLFHKVDVPASLGDSDTNPPKPGAYRNVLLYYEADKNAFLYTSDGMPVRITGVSTDYNLLKNKPSINGVVLIENKTLEELGIIDAIDSAVAAEAEIREDADETLQDNIDAEEGDRIAADNALWDEIETIEAASDVVDVVGSYAELEAYDTSKLHDNDLIKVLQDETRDDAITYYRWSTATDTFSYVGSEGPYYTQSETDTLLDAKQDKLIAGTNIQIAADGKTISATDTTYTAGSGLDLTGTEFSVDTTTIQEKLTAGANVQISNQNVISATDTTYTAGTGLDLNGTEFSVDTTVIAEKSDLPTKTSDLTNDGADGTSTYAETDELPTKTSDLTNDGDGTSAYATEDYVNTYGGKIDKIEVNGVEQAIVNKTVDIAVPTKTSDLTNDSNFPVDANYVHTDNNFTTALKGKLDGIESGAEVNVQSDWSQTTTTADDYIKNKPTIGDATLTIQKNSTTIDTFTANATSNKTIDISVPVDTSDLNNDGDGNSPYATQDYVDTYGGKIDKIEVNGVEQTITNKTVDITVPTKTSDITNDGSDGTSTYVENDDLALDLATKQDKLIAGSNIQIAADGKTISATDTTYSTMTGATSQAAGTSGLVPAPAAGDDTKYLSGDGLWKTISQYQLPIASDSTLGGVKVGSNLSIDSSTGVLSANVNNATLTIQKNGTSAGTFTANASSNKTINITVPTTAADVSALPDSTKYAASISVSVDTTDYKITTTLKDQDGNTLGAAQVIDLPLESVVVSGSYDNVNKKIVLTLENGSTVDIPVGDLVAGLQSEITSSNKLASDLVDDTDQANKFMTAAEKTKLAGIATGAEVNVQSDWDQTNNAADDFIKNKPTIPDPADYYWANVKVSDTSSTSTAPSFGYMKLTRTLTYPHIGGDGTYLAMSADGQWGQGHGSIALKSDALYPSTNESGLINLGEASRLWKNLYLSGDMYHGTYKLTLPNKAGTVALTDDIPAIDSSLSDSSTNPVQNKIITAALNSRVNYARFVTEGTSLYKKVKVSGYSTSSSSVGVTIYGRDQIFMVQTMAAAGYMGTLYEIGTDYNGTAISTNNRHIHVKMKNTSGTPPHTTFYIAMDSYVSCDIWSDGTIEVSDSTATEWNGITSDVTSVPIARESQIPTVNNATLTIQKNGTTVNTFTANASSNVTANITVPTKTSDITNDSGFVTGSITKASGGTLGTTTINSTTANYMEVTKLSTATDLNTIKTTGVYIIAATPTNSPTGAWGTMYVDWTAGTKYQVYINDGVSGNIFKRSWDSSNSTWTSWIRITSADIANIERFYRGLVPLGTAIAANKNLNTTEFLKVGKYYCSADVTVATLTNCPTDKAFMMEVFSPLSTTIDNETTEQWIYRVRILTTYTGLMYIQQVSSGSTAGNFTYGAWSQFAYKSDIGNATLTIQKNGTNVQTFTANATSNATANITVPTKVSDLTNTSGGFITYCTCTSAANATTKTVTVDSGDSNWALRKGTVIAVRFTKTNTASNVKFNVGGSGAKSVYYNTGVNTGSSNSIFGYANRTILYVYDGTNWVWISDGRHDGNDNAYTTAYCNTAAGTAAKTASMTGYILTANRYTVLTITNANTAASALTLNINGKGAKPLYINGAASSSSNYTLAAGSYIVYYDGTNYHIYNNGEIPRMIHSENPSSVVAPSSTVPGSSITDGSITFAKTATGEFLKLQLSTVDIGEGASLPANTLYGVYE